MTTAPTLDDIPIPGPDRLHELADALVARYENRHCPKAVLTIVDELHALATWWQRERGGNWTCSVCGAPSLVNWGAKRYCREHCEDNVPMDLILPLLAEALPLLTSANKPNYGE